MIGLFCADFFREFVHKTIAMKAIFGTRKSAMIGPVGAGYFREFVYKTAALPGKICATRFSFCATRFSLFANCFGKVNLQPSREG